MTEAFDNPHEPIANAAEAEFWNSASGRKWVEQERALDAALADPLAALIEAAAIEAGDVVLDVGCGTGASTLMAAEAASSGSVTGIDVSTPMLERASERARAAGLANARFVLADAQTHAFEAAACDVAISRFGVMFFENPVAAFGNLLGALRPGGRIAFVTWAALADNPWFSLPREIAVARLGPLPAGDPNAPGPMAFQDISRVVAILRAAGFGEVEGRAIAPMLTPPGDAAAVARTAGQIGPAARALRLYEAGAEDAAAIEASLTEALRAYEVDGAVRIPAALNLYTARRPS
ncbi:class I SAM-dependent methyltransferase [Acuticoccus mangrovi]|uniref:Class I SAM-dependent methyltransferase n=1 Tax=Acuticoccus mangrovi TaxID=2796142 RepID=A0A934IS57_9HYPH|nr:class I SAM-dependent methyltransferase [Acuticoccus mangrovi]MBJ3776679.1 class I SAM-dependent methyltransferase [Acuticoccus mangrovi]